MLSIFSSHIGPELGARGLELGFVPSATFTPRIGGRMPEARIADRLKRADLARTEKAMRCDGEPSPCGRTGPCQFSRSAAEISTRD